MNPVPPPLPPKQPITLAVIFAFLPAAIGLVVATLPVPKAQFPASCVIGAIMALICCVTSSVLLFRRNTTVAVVFGILLGLLNLMIAAGIGCAAMLSNFNVH